MENQSEWGYGKEITTNWLMGKASNEYKILNTKEIWEAPSTEDENFIVLEERFSELKKRMDSKKLSVNEANSKQFSNKQNKGQIKEHKNNPYWMFQAPTEENLRNPREWNGTTWKFSLLKEEANETQENTESTSLVNANAGERGPGKETKALSYQEDKRNRNMW